jgi:hypothetical protein
MNRLLPAILGFFSLIVWPSAIQAFHPSLDQGGHDTIYGEGMAVKREIHKRDDDGGRGFNSWVDQALTPLRYGIHDEDSTRIWGIPLPGYEKSIGPNGDGDSLQHFYDPDTGKGLWWFRSAKDKAAYLSYEIWKKIGCTPKGRFGDVDSYSA